MTTMPINKTSQGEAIDTLRDTALVVDYKNGQGIRSIIRPVKRTFRDADQKKKILTTLRLTNNDSRLGKYKSIFFQQALYGTKEKLLQKKELLELQSVNKEA